MHIRPALVALAALMLALTGCGSDDTSADGANAEPSPSTSAPGDVFLASVAETSIPSWNDGPGRPTDEELLTYPPQWCAALAEDHSVSYILDDTTMYPIGQTWGTKKEDANKLVLLAVEAYCPAKRTQVIEELKASGEY